MALKTVGLRILASVVTVVLFVCVGVCNHAPYDARDPENCRLQFSVLSDVHIEGNNAMRYKVFAKALQDIRKNRRGNDAVVFLGDSTMNGQFFENLLFHGAVHTYLRNETVLPVLGNHDIGNGQGDYNRLQNRWYLFTEAFFGRSLTQPYYAEEIDGLTFIVLGMQAQKVHELFMTEAQFLWLETVLDQAAEKETPVFVFSHYPTDYAVDENGDTNRLTDLLSDYSAEHDLFCFVGHTHMPLSLSWSFHTSDGFPQTYLPRLTELSGENDNQPFRNTGVGVVVEVYNDAVLIRGRDFYRGEWKCDAAGETPYAVSYPLRNALR